jgi:hypothetical protein
MDCAPQIAPRSGSADANRFPAVCCLPPFRCFLGMAGQLAEYCLEVIFWDSIEERRVTSTPPAAPAKMPGGPRISPRAPPTDAPAISAPPSMSWVNRARSSGARSSCTKSDSSCGGFARGFLESSPEERPRLAVPRCEASSGTTRSHGTSGRVGLVSKYGCAPIDRRRAILSREKRRLPKSVHPHFSRRQQVK